MADWEFLNWVKAHGTSFSEGTKDEKTISVGLEVKMVGGKPLYQGKVSNVDMVILSKTSNGHLYNAKFAWEGVTYYLNVPYWE